MSGNLGVQSIEQGTELIEEALWERLDYVKSQVCDVVEPFVSGLPLQQSVEFETLARHLIVGIDRGKADRTRVLQVATRTYAVSQLVLCTTLDHPPEFVNTDLINTYIDPVMPTEHNLIAMGNALRRAFHESTCFRSIMQECQPSIDPCAEEPEVFRLFGGFALQSAALGESKRIQAELRSAAASLASYSGDIWELFDNQ